MYKVKNDKKWGFIINPVAGNGFALKYAEKVKSITKQYGLDCEFHFTKHKNHATTIAKELVGKKIDHIIAVGGDGTMNEIVNGIIDENVITGIIPAGTGNDFASVLGFSEHFTDDDWCVFFQEHCISMDVGKCNNNYFLNGMGLGFDAQVASENYNEDDSVKKGGKSKYFWHIIKNLLFYKEKSFYANSDGVENESLTFMKTIANGRRFAGKYYLTPKAIANDGLLDVCHVEPLSLLQRFRIFGLVPKGEHLSHKKVNYYQTKKLILQFENKVPHHLDGELFFADKFDVTILPQKLKIIYNPNGNHYFQV